jgi:phosphatidylserine/phosphatidylglycerophosphate/cardiolipin synthase-like enzyme
MKKFVFAFIFVLPCFIFAQQVSPNIEIVESIPVGTSLDNPDIRDTYEVWLEMMAHAGQSLDIEQFYISNEPGKMLQDVLADIYRAADRGVKVRIIVDARMALTYPVSVEGLSRYKNIELRRIDFGSMTGGIQHAKYFIVDHKAVFVGSQNFDWRALEHIHELGLRINNKDIATIYGDVFNLDWELASDTNNNINRLPSFAKSYSTPIHIIGQGGDTIVITPTFSPVGYIPDSTLWDERAIVDLINGAQHSLTLQFLSYSPLNRKGESYTVIDNVIRSAAKRGVKVRMIVSDWEKGSSSVRALKELSSLPNIEIAFTSIPEWSGGYISFARVEHCKFIVADNARFWLGTGNCEKSYYYSSRNVGIVCTSPRLAGTLSRIFLKSWNSPYKEWITQSGKYSVREHGEKKRSK